MACFWQQQNETIIEIKETEEISNVNYYKIKVTVGDVFWTVSHRYKEFYELHNQLVVNNGVSKEILPSKKVIRNKCPAFIESRRQGLEEYLRKVLVYLKLTMPKIFLEFLHFHYYDIFFLLQKLSEKLFKEADVILSSTKSYEFTPLELHAITECLRKPFPESENAEGIFDLSPVLDLCSQINEITITGSANSYLQSNIIPNKLIFELSSFKMLKILNLKDVNLGCVSNLGSLRSTVEKLKVNNTSASSICQILQCDVIHKENVEGSQNWKALNHLDLSCNNLIEIDKTINLAQNITELILNDNKISSISNLSELSKLSQLSLSNNLISICETLHTKIGNISMLNLSQNNIVSLKGFSKLYSLENLDLSCNKITDIEEIRYIGDLPYLENLLLTGNSVATIVDYRIKVFEYFGDRAKDICLDNEKPSSSELDKVSVLRALRIVKEGKTPNLNN